MLEEEGKEEATKKVKEMEDAKAEMETYITRLQKRKKMKSVLEAIESSSDEENERWKPQTCLNCDKPADVGSKYCSVDCICAKVAKKEETKTIKRKRGRPKKTDGAA